VKKGFTMLEILVAMSLLFVVLATVYQTFQVHVQSTERAHSLLKEAQSARMVLTMMARDLQSAYWEPAEGEETEEELPDGSAGTKKLAAERAKEAEILFMVQPIQQEGKPWDRMAFLTLAPPLGPVASRHPWVRAVEYRLVRDAESGRGVLVRRENAMPGKDLLAGGEEWALAEDVLGFEVQCMDLDGEPTNGWDSRERGYLPASVLLHLWMHDPRRAGDPPTLYSIRVALPPSGEELYEGDKSS